MTVANPTQTTELSAINRMLSIISVAPLNTLEGRTTADVSLARNKLSDESVKVQSDGWWFNTEYDYPLNINGDGKILLAPNIVDVDVSPYIYTDIDPVQRGSTLYDRKNHTDIFSRNLKGVVTLLLPFDDMPETARHYIAVRAGRLFQQSSLGSVERDGFTERDEFDALASMKKKDAENADRSIFQSYSVSRVLDRSPRPSRRGLSWR